MPKRKKFNYMLLTRDTSQQNNRETENKRMLKYKTGKCKHKECGGGDITVIQNRIQGKKRR